MGRTVAGWRTISNRIGMKRSIWQVIGAGPRSVRPVFSRVMKAIETHGLAKAFGETKALNGIDLQIEKGSVYGLLGPNGAGKTTTVRILATLLRPDAGTAHVL